MNRSKWVFITFSAFIKNLEVYIYTVCVLRKKDENKSRV